MMFNNLDYLPMNLKTYYAYYNQFYSGDMSFEEYVLYDLLNEYNGFDVSIYELNRQQKIILSLLLYKVRKEREYDTKSA